MPLSPDSKRERMLVPVAVTVVSPEIDPILKSDVCRLAVCAPEDTRPFVRWPSSFVRDY
jgi:hypothetical protein